MIFSLLMMSRMLLSSACVLVILLCLSQECSTRHLRSIEDHAMDDKAKLLNDSTIKGLGKDPFIVQDDLGLKMTAKGKDRTNTIDNDHQKQTDCGSKNKKDMIKDQKVEKLKEIDHPHQHQHHSKSFNTLRVPLKHKRIHQQPSFNLDYSPPKTHPPSHN